jgi:membrane-associated protease RseP (regulator of RpoE activity)
MRANFLVLSSAGLSLSALAAVAQEPKSCRGPGAAFGVTAYQCASCEFAREQNTRPEFGFHAEPIILRTSPSSVLRSGDIIEAVNGQPITTRAGAEQFTYPKAGTSVIRVRRNGVPVDLTAARPDCDTGENDRTTEPGSPRGFYKGVVSAYDSVIPPLDSGTIRIPGGRDRPTGTITRRRGGASRDTDTSGARVASDTGAAIATTGPATSRFGFAISCVPSCTLVKTRDGTAYWKFDGYPPIAAVRDGSPAAKTGLRVGDLIAEADGLSVLQEDGALRLLRAEKKESIHLTVLRDGKRIGFLVRAP